MTLLTRILAISILALMSTLAVAQSGARYPSKTVRVIVPFGAGGPTDIFSRMYSAYVAQKYKVESFVENKPGAGMVVGADLVAKSPPDGYTLLGAANTLTYESLLNKDAPLDTTKDLIPTGVIAGSGLFIAVNSALPVKNMQEFVAWIKANPGKLNIGTAGLPVAELESLRDRLGLTWQNVNYKGGALANAALLTGEVNMYTPDANQALSAAKEGKVRLLAYTEKQRHAQAPDIPTVAESGIPALQNFEYYVWLGIFAPAGTPDAVLNQINADAAEMALTSDAAKRIAGMGWRPNAPSVAALRKSSQEANEMVSGLLAKGVKLR